jgi:hypothetical protein
MFSMPPETQPSSRPSIASCAADAAACAPEPQTQLTVFAGTFMGMPPLTADWRAGFMLVAA